MFAPAELRVATFNLRNGRAFDGWNSWPFRRRPVAAVIRALDADLVAVQEAFGFQLRFLRRVLPDYEFYGRGRDRYGRGEHTAVMARAATVRVLADGTRWFGTRPDVAGTRLAGSQFPRTATTVTAQLADGSLVDFTSTHLDERSADRRDQAAAQLIEWAASAAGRPAIIAGDFNAPPSAPLFDAFAFAGFKRAAPAVEGATFHRFTGRIDGAAIDHILASDALGVLDCRVVHERPGGRLASDHWPVVAAVRVVADGRTLG